MANREENLKKINVELEMLSDEELDQVAGGGIGQTSGDSKFLYEHGLLPGWHNGIQVALNWHTCSKNVDAGWAKAGITCVTKPLADNKYFIGGKEISREEAADIVRSKFKKVHDLSIKLIKI